MINSLRAPIMNGTWDEMIERTGLSNHPTAQAREFLLRHHPSLKELFDKIVPSEVSYISDLKLAMEYDSIDKLCDPKNTQKIPETLRIAASCAMVRVIAFWDSEESGQEFILPKLPGISMMDQVSIFYKSLIIWEKRKEFKKNGMSPFLMHELDRLEYGSMIFSENFSIYPISSTRLLICFSPYFRAFFPIMDETSRFVLYPPILQKEQFNRHFFEPMRMELFKPCINYDNKSYQYEVKSLTAEEVMSLNAILLDMETEEFVFHDYNKIRDSFWYYDNKAKFNLPKKHNFSHMI